MKLVLFPTDDRPPEELINPRSVTVTAEQVFIEDAEGRLFAYDTREVAELTIDLLREHHH